jgi:hypothetical protein
MSSKMKLVLTMIILTLSLSAHAKYRDTSARAFGETEDEACENALVKAKQHSKENGYTFLGINKYGCECTEEDGGLDHDTWYRAVLGYAIDE